MDTDGYCQADGRCEFSTTTPAIASGAFELMAGLGLKVRMTEGRAMLYGKDCGPKFRLCFTTTRPVFRVARKAARLPQAQRRYVDRTIIACQPTASVPVRCIQVAAADGLFLAGRSFIPTHNSEMVDYIAMCLAQRYGWHWAIFSPEHEFEEHAAKLAEKYMSKPFRSYGLSIQGMSDDELTQAERWVRRHFTFIQHEDEDHLAKIDWILDRVRAVYIRQPTLKGLVIDPYNEISDESPSNETNFVRDLLKKVKAFARHHDLIAFIVVHPSKMQRGRDNTRPIPTLHDATGSAHWYNKADIGFTVHRPSLEKADVDVIVQKVKRKDQGQAGTIALTWDRQTGRYLPRNLKDIDEADQGPELDLV